jgi:hypothetical protein
MIRFALTLLLNACQPTTAATVEPTATTEPAPKGGACDPDEEFPCEDPGYGCHPDELVCVEACGEEVCGTGEVCVLHDVSWPDNCEECEEDIPEVLVRHECEPA